MRNKEKKSYANKLINLEQQLKKIDNPSERQLIEFKIESLVEEIMSTENGFQDFLDIDEIVQKNI